VSEAPSFETDPAVWALKHPTDNIAVAVRCQSPKRCLVAEVQQTPHGRILKLYQRHGRPRAPIEPTGKPHDLSRLVNKTGYEYLERIRRERQDHLRNIGELQQEKLYGVSRMRFSAYNADGPFPDDWTATVICRCADGVITGPMLNKAGARARRTAGTAVVRLPRDRP
jgi:hypothetical protein